MGIHVNLRKSSYSSTYDDERSASFVAGLNLSSLGIDCINVPPGNNSETGFDTPMMKNNPDFMTDFGVLRRRGVFKESTRRKRKDAFITLVLHMSN